MLELVVEFGLLAEAVFEVDGAAFCEDLSSIMGESLYSLELLLKLLKSETFRNFQRKFGSDKNSYSFYDVLSQR